MSRLQIVREWFDEVWIRQELDALGRYFVDENAAQGVRGLDLRPEDFRELVPAMRRMIASPVIEILKHFESADWLWVLVQVAGKCPRSAAPIEFSGQMAIRFSGDQIAEAYNHFDFIGFFEQAGALPPETMALCLSGETLGL
ncbi:hypothetical protein RYZ20_14720 [Thioclava sp. A2]|uniref:hypothetical protein n=1 Tax=Thioclava sp. FCG-A2 TaxID=3080562 RepID=UPI00295598F2|nr:hypothetical protein [Thioclava sp. A2]MDV7272146.1 hypothetical protein [Thioclava sp. A2]